MADDAKQEAQPLVDALPQEVREALEALDEHKGLDIVVLDMRKVSGFTDFMVVCTGRSEPHARALAESVVERLLEHRVKPDHVEGKNAGRWILLDYMQLVVHVFTPDMRSFYQLEKLWRDAPLLEWGVPAGDGQSPAAEGEPADEAEPDSAVERDTEPAAEAEDGSAAAAGAESAAERDPEPAAKAAAKAVADPEA